MGQCKPINTKTILLVEDEAIIRFELSDFFEDAGFLVFEASDATEAIEILKRKTSVRIVLTDINLPGAMNGLRLAHYVRDRYPPTILLLTSGAEQLEPSSLPLNSHFVMKPFDPVRILRMVEMMTKSL